MIAASKCGVNMKVWCDVGAQGCDAPKTGEPKVYLPQCCICGIDVCRNYLCSRVVQASPRSSSWVRACPACAIGKEVPNANKDWNKTPPLLPARPSGLEPKEGTPEAYHAKPVGVRRGPT